MLVSRVFRSKMILDVDRSSLDDDGFRSTDLFGSADLHACFKDNLIVMQHGMWRVESSNFSRVWEKMENVVVL